ncbi:2Fe-2S iron-sulfur cluster-binding protein [Alphaproteobacteria bacterium]|nr:2Fe-2S iron-sulfur cluster-binding protein [Alphaproteobacteria bacterium]
MSGKLRATLKVQRGADGDGISYDNFEVPFDEGASVLDALVWVRANQDASLAFRYSCFNANACKECMVRVNGKVSYACTARLKTGIVIVEPLAKKRLIRDLVTDIVPPKERLCGGD